MGSWENSEYMMRKYIEMYYNRLLPPYLFINYLFFHFNAINLFRQKNVLKWLKNQSVYPLDGPVAYMFSFRAKNCE
jgi:hypothetical protein